VKLDEIECLLIALRRAGHITRDQLIHLQARYPRGRGSCPMPCRRSSLSRH
jgi:hypothetical protein